MIDLLHCLKTHGGRLSFLTWSMAASLLLTIALPPVSTASAVETASPVVVKAKTIFIGNGQVVQNGAILIQDGRIAKVGRETAVPPKATVIEIEQAEITPGLIDANARVSTIDLVPPSRTRATGVEEPSQDQSKRSDSHVGDDDHEEEHSAASGVFPSDIVNEQGSEVVPHTRVIDGMDLTCVDFQRLVRGGVTTVHASPDSSSVIGPRAAVLHTAGRRGDRVLRKVGAVKATIGIEPSVSGTHNHRGGASIYARRPNSRMGLTWVFRKAFHDAIQRGEGLEPYGADTASPEAGVVLRQVLAGEVPLRIQARLHQDIITALRLAGEFDLDFTLEEATEAYRCIKELKAAEVPVVFGPIYEAPSGFRAVTGEADQSRYSTFAALLNAGIETSLSAGEFREEDGLARQAMYAIRFGASFEDTLKAVTQTPARMLGIDKELGTIEPGKRADLIVWSGRPFAAVSRIVLVMVDGRVVVDRGE